MTGSGDQTVDPTIEKSQSELVVKDTPVAGKKRDPLLGTVVAERYELLSLLGRGATTSVYKARDREKERTVAVKILRTDSMFNEQLIRRFEQECKTLALLIHTNIVELYDSGINDTDQPFLVMEFVDGTSLKDLIEADDCLDLKRVLRIFVQICAALAAAHEKGIVHRDMKPANIMLTKDSHGDELVKILDFGVAKLLVQGETFQTKTQTGEMLGTLLYMSPEQCLEQVLDERCDVYSVGCVLYEALTGKPPLVGRTAFETMNKHLTEMPEKLSKVRPDRRYDKRLDAVVRIAMAKNAKDRYQTIGEFQNALSAILVDIKYADEIEPESEPPEALGGESDSDQVPAMEITQAGSDSAAVTSTAREDSFNPSNFRSLMIPVFIVGGISLALLASWSLWWFFMALVFFTLLEFSLLLGAVKPRAEPEPNSFTCLESPGEDSSRDGTLYFLAMESRDGVPWKSIYADQIAQYKITEAEVSEQRTRLIAAQHDAWMEVKDFVMSSFDKLDHDSDGFISKTELLRARNESSPRRREYVFLSFLIANLEDIQNIVNSGEQRQKGVRRRDLSEYFLHLESIEKGALRQ